MNQQGECPPVRPSDGLQDQLDSEIDRLLRRAALPDRSDVLLVVPPFSSLNLPPLAPYLLQAVGRAAGFTVEVLHANLILAWMLGLKVYNSITTASSRTLLGERFFAAAAYGRPPFGTRAEIARAIFEPVRTPKGLSSEWDSIHAVEPLAKTWADLVARAITTRNYRVVGCTTMFDQTSASIALLNRVKALSPATVTILGGANCEGEMAEGIRSIGSNIDHIFSGESDGTFVRFLNKLRDGNTEATSVIRDPQPVMDLDRLPNLDFRGYRGQLETFVPLDGGESSFRRHVVSYPVETSRGCWWGQKHHCNVLRPEWSADDVPAEIT